MADETVQPRPPPPEGPHIPVIPSALPCPACGESAKGAMVRLRSPEGVLVDLHEICFLRGQVQALRQHVQSIELSLATVVMRLGGSVRIHENEVNVARNAVGQLQSTREPGGFVVISAGEPKRVVLARPGEAPPDPPSGERRRLVIAPR